MRTQDYKIELIVKTDVESNPREWLKNAKKYGGFPFGEALLAGTAPNIIKVYSTSVEPIDSGDPEYKFMQDMEQSFNDKASKEDREQNMELVNKCIAWCKARVQERTSWDGVSVIAVSVAILVASPIAKWLAYAGILYGIYTFVKEQ